MQIKKEELWFEKLFGFTEVQVLRGYSKKSYLETQKRFIVENGSVISTENKRRFAIGEFSTPTLKDLRVSARRMKTGNLQVKHEVVGDILELHAKPENLGALFQVASQFNCLEFPGPSVTPEMGITHYALDHTQGPACSLAAAGATVYRNYLVPIDGLRGQSAECQINTLDSLAKLLGSQGEFFDVKNGYTISNTKKLKRLKMAIDSHDRERLLEHIKVGVQSDVGVTFARRFIEPKKATTVSQCFCSAVSAAYSNIGVDEWAPLATLVLDAAYEATLLSAIKNKSKRVWLTFIGGGAFGNRKEWIGSAIGRALSRLKGADLDVRIAHYKKIDQDMVRIINSYRNIGAAQNPESEFISRCRSLWEQYYKNPTKKNLRSVFDHLETMNGSARDNVKRERSRCLRAANKEVRRLSMQR